MGSRSKIDLSYIAGFLDGDGSLMLQIKKRHDGTRKFRFMTTICLYQDTRHEQPLFWIRDILGIGYISRRNDHITELRINGYAQVVRILKELSPYIKFKKLQAEALCKASLLLSEVGVKKLTSENFKQLVEFVLIVQHENYATRRKKTREELYQSLDLTP
ncbi:MAG: site-specific DNA endonuclease [Parcubacteria group bacterium Greene0714_4]|nr:MAG: site-specific DNA endonuclease [Parcubacteria group bacterium Greene0714_4]